MGNREGSLDGCRASLGGHHAVLDGLGMTLDDPGVILANGCVSLEGKAAVLGPRGASLAKDLPQSAANVGIEGIDGKIGWGGVYGD